jgi:hypothetical protein
MAAGSKVSPPLQSIIDKGLLERLPVTFGAFFHDQMKDWNLLFPAEQDYYERLFALIDRSDPKLIDELFAPLRRVEERMAVNGRTWPKGQFTLEQVDFLNRNPHYTEWRKAVSAVFARLDPLLDQEMARRGHARLVIVAAPGELPVASGRMWLRIRDRGKAIAVEPSEAGLADMLHGRGARPLTAEYRRRPYDTWIIEASDSLAGAAEVHISYEGLHKYRERLIEEVQRTVEREQVTGPRQLGARLKQLKLHPDDGELAGDPVMAEFVRAVLLSGNGTLLINNTFVEWAAVQAVRRARPSLAVISFGIRNKVKPFSSLLIYADQDKATPVPTQMDTMGTYVDLEIFYQYIWQEFEKHAEYRNNTAYLFVAEGIDELLVIAPRDFPLLEARARVTMPEVGLRAREWLGL